MRKLIKILIVTYTSNTFANFTGNWLGDGKFVTQKRQGNCFEVYFELKDEIETFEIVAGGYNCSSLNAQYPKTIFIKEKGLLYSEGKNVGSYSKNEVKIFDNENEFQLTFSKDVSEEAIKVKEEWGNRQSYLIIKSILKRF